ncbi:MAG: hypothetical protein HKM93_08865 [Desulfobacteraceae bacterium]|nr:hypothetical protein [Desulfobacteraceae bacterium]
METKKIMAVANPNSEIVKRGVDDWVLSWFEYGKTTREIVDLLNAQLSEGEKPFSQPTVSRFLKPFRDAVAQEKRELVNASFFDDLEKLNLCIEQNMAIANNTEWDFVNNCPQIDPKKGVHKKRSYDTSVLIKARDSVVKAVMKKFDHLKPEDKNVYLEVSGKDGDPIAHNHKLSPELESKLDEIYG